MPTIRIACKEAAWILIIALFLSAGAYAVRLKSGAMEGRDDNEPPAESAAVAPGPVEFDAAVAHFNNGTAIFADARPEQAYRSGHIRGALHLDPHQFDRWSGEVFARIDPDARIITYCDGPRCTLSLDLAEKLTWLGYENVMHLRDGWSRWTAAELPVAVGPSP